MLFSVSLSSRTVVFLCLWDPSTSKVERNSFNVYRCFLAMYGPDAGPEELRKYISKAEHAYSVAFRELDAELAQKWLKQSELLKRHSFGSEGPQGGTWEIPPPIRERLERPPQ